MVRLLNKHIIIDAIIVEKLFPNAAQVCWVYYSSKKTILIASQFDDHFKSLHKTSMSMLKYKNKVGDRSISLEELLIDNKLDDIDRTLEYTADQNIKILSIFI